MLTWRNLRNIGYVIQEQFQQEMTSKAVFMDEQVYQLESESEDEVPSSKSKKKKSVAICKNSKNKLKRAER